MAEKTRGIFQIIFKHFFESFKIKGKSKLIGEDYFGTKYFEEPKDPTRRKSRGRYFIPTNEEDFEQEMPAEWEAWLRYRRTEPPTKEEIEANYKMIIMKRENAAKLDQEYSAMRDKTMLKARSEEQHSSASFPIYKDYDDFGRSGKNTKNITNDNDNDVPVKK